MSAIFSVPVIAFLFRAAVAAAVLAAGCVSRAADACACSRAASADVLRRALPRLREGDIIFIRIRNALYRKVAETSRSWESHTGILFRNPDGAWTVAESTIPFSKFTPLEKFLTHSEGGRFLVRRLRGGLSQAEVLRLRAAAGRRMGILYHLGFRYDSPRLFCSKLVHDSYLEATGREVGHMETFRELLAANPVAPLWFWRIWFLGRIPWERRTVTTTSELQSPILVTVFDSEKRAR